MWRQYFLCSFQSAFWQFFEQYLAIRHLPHFWSSLTSSSSNASWGFSVRYFRQPWPKPWAALPWQRWDFLDRLMIFPIRSKIFVIFQDFWQKIKRLCWNREMKLVFYSSSGRWLSADFTTDVNWRKWETLNKELRVVDISAVRKVSWFGRRISSTSELTKLKLFLIF